MERALVYISSDKRVMMHHLLRKMGREIVRRQSVHEPGKRQFLIDAQEIYDVLADETVSPFIYVFFFFFYTSSCSYGFLDMFKQVKTVMINFLTYVLFSGYRKCVRHIVQHV